MTLKAVGLMALWTIAMISIMNFIGFQKHFNEPLWALGGAIFILVTLIGNVWLFIAVAKEEPWQWIKNSDSSE